MQQADFLPWNLFANDRDRRDGKQINYQVHSDNLDKNSAERSEKCTAESEDIAAFDCVEADQCAEIQLIHTECSGKRAHRSKYVADIFHLPLHFRKEQYADNEQQTDGGSPDDK